MYALESPQLPTMQWEGVTTAVIAVVPALELDDSRKAESVTANASVSALAISTTLTASALLPLPPSLLHGVCDDSTAKVATAARELLSHN